MKRIHLTLITLFISFSLFAQAPASITGTTHVCTGTTTTLTDTTTGGTWTSDNATVATIGSATGIVTGVTAGTANITYTTGTGYATKVFTVYSLPAVYPVTGGGTGCSGATFDIGLSMSSTSETYTLMLGGSAVSTLAGTGGALDFGFVSSSGIYAIESYSIITGCMSNMSGAATIAPLITAYNVIGGGAYCAGFSGVHIGLSSSNTGINYQVLKSGVAVGSPFAGTNSSLDFGLYTAPGTYTVMATNAITTCTLNMTGSTTISINPLPTVYAITGGGTVCGSTGGHIGLSGSEAGTTYQLYLGVAAIGSAVAGTGLNVDFGVTHIAGVYSIMATNPTTACSNSMGSTTLTLDPFAYNVTGGGTFCSGTSSAHIYLSGSDIGVNYQLYNSGTLVGLPMAGTGASLDLGLFTAAGTYTVLGTKVSSGCTNNMNGSALLTINPLPATMTVIGGGSYCPGTSTGVNVGLNASMVGISYSLLFGGTTMSITSGTGGALSFGLIGTPGIYKVRAISAVSGCTAMMADSAIVSSATSWSGTPLAGSTSSSASNVCMGSTINLSLPTATTGCGVSYQWQSSADGITFTNIAGAVSQAYSFVLSSTLYYRCQVTCTNSGLYSFSTPILVSVLNTIGYHSVSISSDTTCAAPDFYISACGVSSSFNVTTWFGDGNFVNTPLSSVGVCHADVYHTYASPGIYTIKQVLYLGTLPQDSVVYSYEYLYCNTLPIKYYLDVNSNCSYDAGDRLVTSPILTEVDSNGIPVDTISSTSGLYYHAHGAPGTVYRFKALLTPGGLGAICPSSGVIYDTIKTASNYYPPKYFAVSCGSVPSFDLHQSNSQICGRHMSMGTIIVGNNFCTSVGATLSVTLSPKYDYTLGSAYPAPSSVSGNTITWNIGSLSSTGTTTPTFLYTVNVPNPYDYLSWLIPGDTIQTKVFIGSLTGDVDTSNNVTIRVDTVKSSYDPNELSVSPQGNVLPCTPLQYTINFENTGNDTAHNITVLDTLSPNLDPKSLRIVAASSAMNVAILKSGGLNIVKFDFPGINLPDSSHHNQCDGMVVFTIKTRNGLTDGSTIANVAGIYFDDNPVVMTNSVANLAGISPITGAGSICVSASTILTDATPGGTWSLSNSHAFMAAAPAMAVPGKMVVGYSAGTDTLIYTVTNACTSKTVKKPVAINPPPAPITGSNHVCTGANTTLADTNAGGKWVSSNPAVSAIDSLTGIMSGISIGNDTIVYTLPTGCATQTLITVNSLPGIYSITGGGSYCSGGTGAHVGLSGSDSLLHYQLYNGLVATGSPVTATGTAIDFGILTNAGTYSVVATNPSTGCKSNMSSTAVISVLPLPTAYTVTGGGSFCASDSGVHVRLSGSASGITYQLFDGSVMVGSPVPGTGAILDFGLLATAGTYSVTASNTSTTCSNHMAASAVVNINALPSSFMVSGGGSYCAGDPGVPVLLTGSNPGISYQLFNGVAPVGGPMAGTGTILNFGSLTAAGTYSVTGTDITTGCHNSMSASVGITINTLPAVYIMTGGGTHCAGDTGVHVSMTGSATGVNYQLYKDGIALGSVLAGNGGILDFGLLTEAGGYTAIATETTHHCSQGMNGTAVIEVIPTVTPAISITNDAPDSICMGTMVTYNASPVNGGASPAYQWKVNGIASGTGSTYSYYPVNGDIVTAVLTSNAVCPLPATATTGMSMTVDSSYNPVVTISASNHGKLEIGQADTFTAVVTNAGPSPYYQWSINGTSLPGANSSVFIYGGFYENDMVNCEVKGSTLCGTWGTSNSIQVRLINVGIRPLNNTDEIALYPNPNTGVFSLKGKSDFAVDDLISLVITDILGRKIYQSDIKTANGIINEEIDLAKSYATLSGMYILTLRSGSGSREFNFVINK